jgi:beta-lactamase superfamily II metal-dependent hydrolase
LNGAQMLRTDSAGAVLVRLEDEGISVQPYRGLRRRYWYSD